MCWHGIGKGGTGSGGWCSKSDEVIKWKNKTWLIPRVSSLHDPSDVGVCMSNSSMRDIQHNDGREGVSIEEEQHCVWDQMQEVLQRCLQEEEVCRVALVVPLRAGRNKYVHGVVSGGPTAGIRIQRSAGLVTHFL